MRYLILLITVSTLILESYAQNLSPDQQKKLLEEVKVLRERVKVLETKASSKEALNPGMMETLNKGIKYQEDQQKALDDLDKDD
ncbi:MAG TPA: hypothetical protein VNJ01_11325 [Bacteriovoracaceae bacterium]|nr:hypothetical protein [Bacteriovoracaceae bacterium]